MMRTTTETITLPPRHTDCSDSTEAKQRPWLMSATSFFAEPKAPESLPQEKTAPIPTYTKVHCDKALEALYTILITYRESPEYEHFASKPIARLAHEAGHIALQEAVLQNDDINVSATTADTLDDFIFQMRESLLCPLSRQNLTDPVLDPLLVDEPFRLAFERNQIAHFYELQRATKESKGIVSTECSPFFHIDVPTVFPEHRFVKDLCIWLQTYFPENHTEQAVVDATHDTVAIPIVLPTHLSVYTCNIAISGSFIDSIELDESTRQHEGQRAIRLQRICRATTTLEKTKIETEKMLQEETERLMSEIKGLTDQCEARCIDLKKMNINTEEKLNQEKTLRAELDKKLQDITKLYWEKLNEYTLTTEQLRDIQGKLTQMKTLQAATEGQLKQTESKLVQQAASYNSALSFLQQDRDRLQQTVGYLQSAVSNLEDSNRQHRDEIRQASSRSRSSGCSML